MGTNSSNCFERRRIGMNRFKTCKYSKKGLVKGYRWCNWFEKNYKNMSTPIVEYHVDLFDKCAVESTDCEKCKAYRSKVK